MRFKDFEIRPMCFLDGHTDPKKWDVVKWCKCEPHEVLDLSAGKKKISDTYCFSVGSIEWNEKEPCWEFRSVGTRFLEYYEEGLCEFIYKWTELADLRGDLNMMNENKRIPVTERLPDTDGSYLVTTATGTVTTARFYTSKIFPPTHYRPTEYISHAKWQSNRQVTHWMPLPEPPKGD